MDHDTFNCLVGDGIFLLRVQQGAAAFYPWHDGCSCTGSPMIQFTTIPLKYEGTLEDSVFSVPDSPSTETLLNTYVRLWTGQRYGSMDPELELYNCLYSARERPPMNPWAASKLTDRN